MAKRLMRQFMGADAKGNILQTAVYKDSEWGEYVVRLYVNSKEKKGASYHTTDKADALSTGRKMAGL